MAKIEPPDTMLLLLGDMVDKRLVHLSNGHGLSDINFVSLIDGNRINSDSLGYHVSTSEISGLYKRGLIKRASQEKVEIKLEELKPHEHEDNTGHLAWFEYPDITTGAGVLLVEAQRDRLNALRDNMQAIQDTPRFVASKAHEFHKGILKAAPGVGKLYVIVGETPQRWRVKQWDVKNEFDYMTVGHGVNQMLPKENVAAIDISPAQFEAMREATKDWNERMTAARSAAMTEENELVTPIRQRLAQRENQLLAMFEDSMREANEGEPLGPKGPNL